MSKHTMDLRKARAGTAKFLRAMSKDPMVRAADDTLEALRAMLGAKRYLRGSREDIEECQECGGRGFVEWTGSEHDPRCDGTCAVGCPVPVPMHAPCPSCGGEGRTP